MNIERIDQPVRVLAAFEGGQCSPMRFVWNGRTYAVDRVNGRWVDRQGDAPALNYSVQVGDQTYYLRFDTEQMLWRLEQVILP